MKRFSVLIILSLLLLAMVLPAHADDNKNQIAQVLKITEGVQEESVMKMYHLQDEEMMEVYNAFRKTEEAEEILPKGMKIDHLTMIRQRYVYNEGEPIEISLRAWGAKERYIVVFFKSDEDEEEKWVILAAAQGEYIDVVLPGDGEYAMALSW